MSIALSVVIPAMNEAHNLARLIPQTRSILARLGSPAEIIVVVGPSTDNTLAVAHEQGAQAIEQTSRGYGGALAEGFAAAHGEWILTMDADLSHPPVFIQTLWAARSSADLLIASRYVRGGRAIMPWSRYILSRILNASFPFLLSLPVHDMSSGFRLYRRAVVRDAYIAGRNFDALQELLLHTFTHGWLIRELPFAYQPRGAGRSKASLARFARSYLETLWRMWSLRNSAECADSDAHAYGSRNVVQRSWHHWRHRVVLSMTQNYIGSRILDINCGSSHILLDLPGAVGLDLNIAKLRYVRRHRTNPVVVSTARDLPFRDGHFDCVICLDAANEQTVPVTELLRVLNPQGMLIIGGRNGRRPLRQSPLPIIGRPVDVPLSTDETHSRTAAELHRCGWFCTYARSIVGTEQICAFQRDPTWERDRYTLPMPVATRGKEMVPA